MRWHVKKTSIRISSSEHSSMHSGKPPRSVMRAMSTFAYPSIANPASLNPSVVGMWCRMMQVCNCLIRKSFTSKQKNRFPISRSTTISKSRLNRSILAVALRRIPSKWCCSVSVMPSASRFCKIFWSVAIRWLPAPSSVWSVVMPSSNRARSKHACHAIR